MFDVIPKIIKEETPHSLSKKASIITGRLIKRGKGKRGKKIERGLSVKYCNAFIYKTKLYFSDSTEKEIFIWEELK